VSKKERWGKKQRAVARVNKIKRKFFFWMAVYFSLSVIKNILK